MPNNLYKHSVQYNFTVIKKDTKKAEVKAILKRCVHKRNQACNHQNTPKNATYDYSLPPKKVYLLDTDSNNNSSIFWMYLTSYKKTPNICMYRIHSRTYLCLCLHTVHYRAHAHAPAFGLFLPTILLPICVCSGHPSKAQPLLHTYYIA